MDKAVCTRLLHLISASYQGRFEVNRNVIEIWSAVFADCEEEHFKKAVMKYCKTSKFPPSIADIDEALVSIRKSEINLDVEFDRLLGSYPCAKHGNRKAKEIYFEHFKGLQSSDKRMRANEILAKTSRYIKNCEMNKQEPMEISEWLKEV